MSYTRSLAIILKERDPELFARLARIEEDAKKVLTYTAAAFPFFTPHDFWHSKKVEDNLNWLIPDDIKPRLNNHEIFFLIVAAWLHDWGMVCSSGELPEDVRPNHHVRTETNLEKMYPLVALDRAEGRIIGRIARGHRLENLSSRLFDDQVFATNVPVRVRFLSAILRLADECDITFSRVPELLYYSLNPQGASKEHFDKHLNIGGIGKGRYGKHKIVFNAVAWDPKGAETLKAVRNKIQKELDEIKGILVEEGVLWEFVEANIDAKGFIDKPISFRLDQTNVTQILIGEALYSRKDVAIRELLQNSVDSCKLQKSLHPKTDVSIRIYRDDDKLVVEDNGAGMDFDSAFEFLSNKGLSYYRSEEFKSVQKNTDFDPISRWGLGVLSYFLISDGFEIETKKEGKDACRFVIKNAREGWRYEQGFMTSSGTKIILTLSDYGKTLDVDRTIRYYLKETEIPIFMGRNSTKPSNIDWTADDEVIQAHIDACLSEIVYSSVPVERPRVISQWTFTTGNLRVRWLTFSRFLMRSALLIANQGFFVRKFDGYTLAPLPDNCIVLVNGVRDILDLDVSRENLRTNTEKAVLFQEELTSVLIEGFKRDFDEFIGKHPESLQSEFTRALAFQAMLSLHRLSPEDYLEENNGATPKAYKQFLYQEMPFHVVSTKGHNVATLAQVVGGDLNTISICNFTTRNLFDYANYDDILASGIDLAASILKKTLRTDEAVIFTSGRTIGDPLSFYSSLLKELGSNCHVSQLMEFNDVVSSMDLEIKTTELDSLLPLGSHFATFPSQLRGGVICRAPFLVRASKIIDDPFTDTVSQTVARMMLGLPLNKEFATLKIIEQGSFLFDSEGELCKNLIENSRQILSNEGLREITKNYFCFLATSLLTGLDSPEPIEVRERELSNLLPFNHPIESKRALLSRVMMQRQSARRASKFIRLEYEPGAHADDGGIIISRERL